MANPRANPVTCQSLGAYARWCALAGRWPRESLTGNGGGSLPGHDCWFQSFYPTPGEATGGQQTRTFHRGALARETREANRWW